MPQLDKVTFYSQVFWLLIIFFTMHYLFLKQVLPTIAAALKYRHNVLSSFSKVRDGLTPERSKISELQKTVLQLPLSSLQAYLLISNNSVNSLLLKDLSSGFQSVLYKSSPSLFGDVWQIYKLRSDLKNKN